MEKEINQSTDTVELCFYIAGMVARTSIQICAKHDIEVSTPELREEFDKNTTDKLLDVIMKAKKDAMVADIFQNIPNGTIDNLVKTCFQISLMNECVEWSKQIVIDILHKRLQSLDSSSKQADELANKIISIKTNQS